MKFSKSFRFWVSYLLAFLFALTPSASIQISAGTIFEEILLDASGLIIEGEHLIYDLFNDGQMLYEEISEEGFETTYNDNPPSAATSWLPGWNWNESAVFSFCRSVTYGNGFSMVVDNTDYDDASMALTIPVSARSVYRFSAMVRVEGFSNHPDDELSGASLGVQLYDYYFRSARHTDIEWTRLVYEFVTTDAGEVTFYIRNGCVGATNRGRAYFSDIKIERADTTATTSWNVLTLIFWNFDAPGFERSSLNYAEVQLAKDTVNLMRESIFDMSNGFFSISTLDFVEIDEPIRVIDPGFYHTNLDAISHILDYHLSNVDYDHIILFTPLRHIAQGWAGLGGVPYLRAGMSEVNQYGIEMPPSFPEAVFIHEMLHDFERRSLLLNPNTACLHEHEQYGYSNVSGDERRAWYTSYMRNTLPCNNGIDRRVFTVQRAGNFVTIYHAAESILTLSRTTWDAPQSTDSTVISVRSNGTRSEATSDQTWLTVSSIRSFNRAKMFRHPAISSMADYVSPDALNTVICLFSINAAANNTTRSRTATISVTSGTQSRTIVVTQDGVSGQPNSIAFTPDNALATANVGTGFGGRVPITVINTSASTMEVTITANWSANTAPALFSVRGSQLAFQNYNKWSFSHTITLSAGQSWSGLIGTNGNVARSFDVTTIWHQRFRKTRPITPMTLSNPRARNARPYKCHCSEGARGCLIITSSHKFVCILRTLWAASLSHLADLNILTNEHGKNTKHKSFPLIP